MSFLAKIEKEWTGKEFHPLNMHKNSLLKDLYSRCPRTGVPVDTKIWRLVRSRSTGTTSQDVELLIAERLSGMHQLEKVRTVDAVRYLWSNDPSMRASKVQERFTPPLLLVCVSEDRSVLISSLRFDVLDVKPILGWGVTILLVLAVVVRVLVRAVDGWDNFDTVVSIMEGGGVALLIVFIVFKYVRMSQVRGSFSLYTEMLDAVEQTVRKLVAEGWDEQMKPLSETTDKEDVVLNFAEYPSLSNSVED